MAANVGTVTVCVNVRTEAEVKAEALREAADALYGNDGPGNSLSAAATWLRVRADRVEGRGPQPVNVHQYFSPITGDTASTSKRVIESLRDQGIC